MAIRPPAMFFLPDTTTLLARSAIDLLRSANQTLLDEAVTTLRNRNLSAAAVMQRLEQNVHFAEVLQKLAKDWSPETQRTFAAAFNMEPTKTDIMDLIVAIAILNEVDLEAELRGENTSEATETDLLENRKITWQYPPPGTLLDPPYLVLVAVEHQDTATAESEVQSILGELVDYEGYKIPKRMPSVVPPIFPGRLALADTFSRVRSAAAAANQAQEVAAASTAEPPESTTASAAPAAKRTREAVRPSAAGSAKTVMQPAARGVQPGGQGRFTASNQPGPGGSPRGR